MLRETDLRRLLDTVTGLEVIENTYRDYGAGDIQRLSEPASMFGGSGRTGSAKYKAKGATLMSEGVTGIRMISDNPRGDRVRSYHLLCVFDDETGAPIGLLDEVRHAEKRAVLVHTDVERFRRGRAAVKL